MSTAATARSKTAFSIRQLTYIALMTALIAVCSWISIPVFDVPYTLQTFAVFAAVGLLGGRDGTIAILIYILLGAVGVPVFANLTGGIGILLGNTGGYIIGFLASGLIFWLITKLFGNKLLVSAIAYIIGLALCYAIGTVWFVVVYTKANGAVSFAAALSWCVIPFIIPDLIKIAAALLITNRIRRYVKL